MATYRAKIGVKLNQEAVEYAMKLAKGDNDMLFSEIKKRIKERFNLAEDEARKAVKAAEINLAKDLLGF